MPELTQPQGSLPTKRKRASKTLWFNGVASLLILLDVLASQLQLMQPVIPPAAWPYVVAAITIVNMWLRLLSKTVLRRDIPGVTDADK